MVHPDPDPDLKSSDSSDSTTSSLPPKPTPAPNKSSSEILNELFGTFNTSYDESEALANTSSKSKKKKKDKKKKKEKSKDKDKTNSKVKKEKNVAKNSNKVSSSSPPVPVDGSRSSSESIPNSQKPIYPTITFRGQTITLDIEEGEIIDDPEKKSEKKKKRKEIHEKEADGETLASNSKVKKKKRHTFEVEDIRSARISDKEKTKSKTSYDHEHKSHSSSNHDEYENRDKYSTSSSHNGRDKTNYEHDRERDHYEHRDKYSSSSNNRERHSYYRDGDLHKKDAHFNSSRTSHSYNHRYDNHDRRRSRSGSPHSSRYSYDKSSYSSRWQKARDSEYSDYRDRKPSYYENLVRRNSDYEYEEGKKYNHSRGGFGYSGSSSRYEDDYYDYHSSRSNRYYHHRDRRIRSRSRSRERSTLRRLHPDDIICKATLLEIARKNAAKLMKSGVMPTDIFSRDQIVAIRAGGKSVEELTEYCKKVAERDAAGDADDHSSDDEIIHPFNVKDKPLPMITMNIRNAVPLPIRTPHELAIEHAKLRIQFPVSSGTQHRYKEIEWKPVDDKDKEKDKTEKRLVPLSGKEDKKSTDTSVVESDKAESASNGLLAITNEDSITEEDSGISYTPKSAPQVDIGTVISKRLQAMRDLQEDPDNSDAKDRLDTATREMKEWAEAKALEPKFLSPAEILGGPQAWVKKDQLKNAAALTGGMGMHLLQRMGWKPGEGLGKYKEGTTEPLALEIKNDKKGLATSQDNKGPSLPSVFDLSGKHPVSSLMELCAKRHWGTPTFELCFEHGPSHKPQFVYKVTVNGVEYQPCIATMIKKDAKMNAAAFCLQSLGLLPTPKAAPNTSKAKPELLKTVTPVIDSKKDSLAENTSSSMHSSPFAKPKPPPRIRDLRPPPKSVLPRRFDPPLRRVDPPSSFSFRPPPGPNLPSSVPIQPLPLMSISRPEPFSHYPPAEPSPPPPPPDLANYGFTYNPRESISKGSSLMNNGQPQVGYFEKVQQFPMQLSSIPPAPIIQVPLPTNNSQGFPGLTTF